LLAELGALPGAQNGPPPAMPDVDEILGYEVQRRDR